MRAAGALVARQDGHELRLPFPIEAERKGDVEFLRLGGAVAGATSPQLADLLRCSAELDQVVIDLSDCRLLDGAALQVLLDVSRRVRMTVICPHECLSGVLRFVGLAELAQIVSSIDLHSGSPTSGTGLTDPASSPARSRTRAAARGRTPEAGCRATGAG